MRAITVQAKPESEETEVILAPKRAVERLVADLIWTARVILSACSRFYWDNGFSRAASLAYTTLLSIVPVTALAFGFLASFAASKDYVPAVREFIFRQFAPSTHAVDEVIIALAQFSEKLPTVNVFVIAFVVATSILLLNSVEYVLNEVWQVYEARSMSQRVAIFCAILVIAPVLAISGYYTLKFQIVPLLEELRPGTGFAEFYSYLFGFLVDFVAFLSLYYLVPKAPVRITSATFGALIATLCFGLAKHGFAIYIARFYSFTTYAEIYGVTLAVIPIFLFWLYLSWTIVLLGAEMCFQAQYLPKSGRVWKRHYLSVGDGKMVLAMQVLVIVARAFHEGERLPTELELTERLGCSSVVLKGALNRLERAEVIARGDDGSQRVTLIRSAQKITLDEIRVALYGDMAAMHFPEEMARLFEFFKLGTDRKKVTLADVIHATERKS